MTITKIEKNGIICAIISSDEPVIIDAQSALDVLMTAKYDAGTKNIVINKKLVAEDFFILSSGLAGEILQKYINYGGRIAIYGDFSHYTSKPLHGFIYESNKGKDVFFVGTKEEAIDKNKVMNQLIENAVALEIKKYQNEKPKNTIEVIKNAKKRECLEENGITTSSETTENEKDEKQSDEIINEKNKKKSSNISIPKHNNFIFPEDMTYTPSNSNIPFPKAKNKPYIEQFEFIQKIKEEQKKFISAPRKNNSFNKNLNNNDNYNNYYYSANPSSNIISPKITDSFRKKSKKSSEVERQFINDEKNYSSKDKKNHRSTREINEYLREKKIKNKQIEETKQLEKNKKLFLENI